MILNDFESFWMILNDFGMKLWSDMVGHRDLQGCVSFFPCFGVVKSSALFPHSALRMMLVLHRHSGEVPQWLMKDAEGKPRRNYLSPNEVIIDWDTLRWFLTWDDDDDDDDDG